MIIYQVANTISNDCDNCSITTQRKQYITLGYEPIPCRGKIPVSKSWQNIRIDFDTTAFWSDEYPDALNTGIRTRYTPAIDIDVYDGEMVEKIRQELLNLIPSGSILERIGQPPKVLIPFQGAVPFNKIAIAFKSLDNRIHRVEVLCDGQQFIADGTHPDTGKPYQWKNNADLSSVARKQLPIMDEALAHQIIDCAANIMRDGGWIEIDTKGNAKTTHKMNGSKSLWAQAALNGECEKVRNAAHHTRNDTLNAAAFALGQTIGGGELDRTAVEQHLFEAARICGLVDDDGQSSAWATIKSGITAGMKHPRATPNSNAKTEHDGNDTKQDHRPVLVINEKDPTDTAKRLSVLIAQHSEVLFNGNEPVRVASEAGHIPKALPLNIEYVRVLAHELCRPVRYNKDGMEVDAPLNSDVANIYLNGLEGQWNLRPFKGITTCPVLGTGGSIRTTNGYDSESGLWCSNVPTVAVPEQPTEEEAKAALGLLRHTFRTFPFADATMKEENGVMVVTDPTPGMDESSFLAGLMTAVCRQSLETAPGFLTDAPNISGAGTGKGLLVKACCVVASGIRPHAFTSGHDAAEFDKRLTAALVEARPCVFLDNFNAKELKSDILASALTENPAMVRIFGKTKNVPLFTTTFIAVTGNGVQIAEDTARRMLVSRLDARMENPEQRKFKAGFLDDVFEMRTALLTAALTIWRWGQQNANHDQGLPLGNYEVWAHWVRDPLLSLGCRDPVERIVEIKAADPRRRAILAVFEAWWANHEGQEVKAADLHDEVKRLLDPKAVVVDGKLKASRQVIAWWLQRHKGTRIGGYWLEEVRDTYRSRPTVTYRLHDGSEEFASFGPRVGNGPLANDNFQTTTSFGVGCMTA